MKKNKATRGKIAAAKGFGPRHAENAREGETVDLTKVNTDSVPAMLTPREAVMNRNAAELAGRDNIEALNAEGNKLAKQGVDLAARGQTSVAPVGKKVATSNVLKYVLPGEIRREAAAQLPKLKAEKGETSVKTKKYQDGAGQVGGKPQGYTNTNKYGVAYGWNPAPQAPAGGGAPVGAGPFPDPGYGHGAPDRNVAQPMPFQGGGGQGGMANPGQPGQKVNAYGVPYGWNPAAGQSGGGFYPPGQTKFGALAQGTEDVTPPIGSPNTSTAYGPPITLSAPDLASLLAKAGQQNGLNSQQIAGLAKAFQGFGQGGGGGGDVSPDQFWSGSGGYQGGISDIGYPPFIAPGAEYHADKGSTWVGPYDPQYLVQRYARGSRDIPDWAEPDALGEPDFGRPSTIGFGGRQGYINRSSFNPSAWGGGQPGMPWSPTAIPTSYNPQGYPYGVPVQGPDQNLQGVGRTHNLRKNQ